MKKFTTLSIAVVTLITVTPVMNMVPVLSTLAGIDQASAGRRGGGGGANRQVRSQASSNVNRGASHANRNVAQGNRNVNGGNAHINNNNTHINNNNVNINKNVNVNVDDHHGGWDNDWDDHYHPIATAAAVTATVAVTAAVIGSIAYTLPPSCGNMVVGGVAYYQCGNTWYQPQYVGTTVNYIVVNPPH